MIPALNCFCSLATLLLANCLHNADDKECSNYLLCFIITILQQLFDVEVSRHIQEKKNMTLELERVALDEHDQIRLSSQQEWNSARTKVEQR